MELIGLEWLQLVFYTLYCKLIELKTNILPRDWQRQWRNKGSKLFDQVLEKILAEHEQDTSQQHRDLVDVQLPLMNQYEFPGWACLHNRPDKYQSHLTRLDYSSLWCSDYRHWVDYLGTSRVMKKLQQELRSVIGMDRIVEEKDLEKLG